MSLNKDTVLLAGLGNLGSKIAQVLNQDTLRVFTPQKRYEKKATVLGKKVFNPSRLDGNPASDFKPKIIILCVKPPSCEQLAINLSPYVHESTLIVSCIAGLTIQTLSSYFGGHINIARIMPNLAVAVQKSNTAYSLHPQACMSVEQQACFFNMLKKMGISYAIPEHLFDIFTAIAGSGIAYIATFIDALVKSAVQEGFSYDLAYPLILDCMQSTASTLQSSTFDSTQKLCDAVSSPGGVTLEGLRILRSSDFQKNIFDTIDASVKKSHSITQNYLRE